MCQACAEHFTWIVSFKPHNKDPRFTDRDFKVWAERGVFKVIQLTTGRARLKPMSLNLCSEKAAGRMENSDFEFHRLEVLVFSSIKWG